jgi:outer membrane protein assembly factor BamB
MRRILMAGIVLVGAAGACPAEEGSAEQGGAKGEWPQFHGPRRDNLSTDTGLLTRWPPGGPPLIWKADGIGEGFASVAVTGGTIYTAGNIGRRTVITALDMSGRRRWQAPNGPAYRRSPPGARATPTIAFGKLYHLNGDGDVVCLDAGTGKGIWTRNILKEFNGRNIRWGLSESPLVDGSKVICCPGGEKVSMVALDRDTGKTVWTCKGAGDRPGYASAVLVNRRGLRQIITMMGSSAVGVEADTGRLLWRHEFKVAYEATCASPVYHDGHVAIFGTWGRGAALLKLHVDGDRCTTEEIWRTKELDNEHGGVVLVDGYLYGQADGNHKQRHWACLEMKTGKTMYSVEGLPGRTGTLTYADGMLYVLNDRRSVALVPASPKGWRIAGRFQLPKGGRGMTWAHPVVCGGRLFLRHGDFLYVYDVRGKAPGAGG